MSQDQFVYFENRVSLIKDLGFPLDRVNQLKKYITLLWQANSELNLFSRKMLFSELVDNHVIDCLLALKYFPKNIKSVADLGSGGGLPAIIYAIAFSEIKFILFEKSPKKQNFLNSLSSMVSNIEIRGEIPNHLSNIDLITARAFKPIDVILDITRGYYQDKGAYFLLKGRKEKIDEEYGLAIKKFKNLKIQVTELKSPVMDVERNLVLI